MALLGLLPRPAGRVLAGRAMFGGVDLLRLPPRQLRDLRGNRIAMIFQDPLSSLNPVLTVGRQLTEQLKRHRNVSRAAARERAVELLALVGIPDARRRFGEYPHQMSGGMRQRVMIAMALSCEPDLLIADEPTTALDVTIQAQILDLLQRLRRELGMALLLITHDLGVVAGVTDRVAVMYAGRVVETGPTEHVLSQPQHPYTRGLLNSLPRLDQPRGTPLVPVEGSPPDLGATIAGCPFRPRCPYAIERCTQDPPLIDLEHGQAAACWVLPFASRSV
jgi:oligopeptide/dipeptide ABC transporter ATP-binding protein